MLKFTKRFLSPETFNKSFNRLYVEFISNSELLHNLQGPHIFKKFYMTSVLGNNPMAEFKKSYNSLPPDKDYPNNDPPVRLRRFARYSINKRQNGKWEIIYNPDCRFTQNVDDFRKNTRVFPPIESRFQYDDDMMNFISYICYNCVQCMYSYPNLGFTNKLHKFSGFDVSLHQVRQIAYPDKLSDNAPEGIHRDGADFIVSALVLHRTDNLKGAESILYDSQKKKVVFKTILQENEGIFQEDIHMWHDITEASTTNDRFAIRDILGLDVKITYS